MVQRTCATAMSDESLRTCTSAIASRLSLKTNANASVSLLRISSRPFHHQPITLTTSPSGVNRSAYAAASCAFQAATCFDWTASIAAWSLVAAAATVDEIAASSSSFEIREPVNTSAPLSQSSEDDDATQPGLNRRDQPLLWTHCDDVDFHQGATIASGQDHLHRGAGGLVRLLLGAEELGVSGHHPLKIHLAAFRGIGPEVDTHHHDVAQRQFLRFEELLNVSDQTLGL